MIRFTVQPLRLFMILLYHLTSSQPSDVPLLESSVNAVSDTTATLVLDPEIETDSHYSEPADSLPPIEKMPEVVHRVQPEYPPECARKGIEGTVVLDCMLSDSGTVDSIAVVKSVHPMLDGSAVDALRLFRFSPAIAGGQPVPVLLQYEIPFTLVEVVEKVDRYINLQGTLLESGTRTPVTDAMVVITFPDTMHDSTLDVPFSTYLEKLGTFEGQHLEENNLVTFTDSLGKFTFYSLPACSVLITAPLPGYEPIKEKERITHGEMVTVTYYTRRISYNDYEIVVYGKTEEKEVARHQLTLTEVRKLPGLGNDAVRVVQALPGVSRPSFGSGDIIVRGAPSGDSRYFLDGTSLPLLYHMNGLKSVYNSEALESIDFYPGGFSTRYGGAIAGIIELKGRPAKNDRWHGQLDLNAVDGSCLIEGPVTKKLSLLVSARRSFVGDIASWYMERNADKFPVSITPFYYDILARGDLKIADNNNVFATFLFSRDSLGLLIPSLQGGSTEFDEASNSLAVKLRFATGSIGWDYTFTPKLKNTFRYSLTDVNNFQSFFGYARVEERAQFHHIRDELILSPSPIVSLAIGADATLYDEDIITEISSGSDAIRRDTTNNWLFGVVGAYAYLTFTPTERLQIVPGIRYDYYPELIHDGGVVPEFWDYKSFDNDRGFSGDPSLRISGRYKITEKQTMKASVGNYNQTPDPMGQVIHKTWGDPSIPTTKAVHYIAGYEWRFTDLFHLDLQCYLNRQWDLPRMATSEDQLSNPNSLWLADGKGRMKGVELLLRHDNNGRFFGWIAYSLSKSERWDPHENKYHLYTDDETHNIQLLASYHLKRDWDIGCRIRYVTGKPTTPVIGVVENEPYNYFEPIYGEEYSDRMDPFFQIDVRVDKKFVFKKWMFSTYLDIQNLSWLFYKSPEMVVYNYDYSEKQTVSMIIQPALGFRVEF